MNKSNFKIGNKMVGSGYPVLIVAEISANHLQNFERAKKDAEIENLETYQKGKNNWQSFFVSSNNCIFCPAWRICIGKFTNLQNQECSSFFNELLEACEINFKMKKENNQKELCQL